MNFHEQCHNLGLPGYGDTVRPKPHGNSLYIETPQALEEFLPALMDKGYNVIDFRKMTHPKIGGNGRPMWNAYYENIWADCLVCGGVLSTMSARPEQACECVGDILELVDELSEEQLMAAFVQFFLTQLPQYVYHGVWQGKSYPLKELPVPQDLRIYELWHFTPEMLQLHLG